jgi:hypothetical protein
VQTIDVYGTVSDRNGLGLLPQALEGAMHSNLLLDAGWTSPALLPLALLGALTGLRDTASRAVVAALLLVATPLFAVFACSSDAVRYQSVLLGLLISVAVTGIWRVSAALLRGGAMLASLRMALLVALCVLPLPGWRAPLDPSAAEHQLVADAVRHLAPNTLIVLPPPGGEGGRVRIDFPQFLLAPGARAVFAGDPAIEAHRGPQLRYLGLACVSWDRHDRPSVDAAMRPECQRLRDGATPWQTRVLAPDDIPRDSIGAPWTFFQIITGVPFGFFSPPPP